MSFCSLGCVDSDDVSFVIFQHGVCQPFWSKWKTVFLLLLLQNLSNSSQNWLRWSLDRAAQKWLNRIFWVLVKKKVMMLWTTRSTQIGSEAVSRPNFDQSKLNLVCFINTIIWGPMPKLGTAPPMGREIPKMHNFAYNFRLVCQKIMFLVSLDSSSHAKSEDEDSVT